MFILIFIPWGLNVLWLHADMLVKFSSIILINCSCVLHKNKSVKQIPTKYQCIFFNKMAPCIHPLKCWILNTEKLWNNKWLHQSNPGMNGNDNFSCKAGLIHIKWSVCLKCKHSSANTCKYFMQCCDFPWFCTIKIPVGEKKNPEKYDNPLPSSPLRFFHLCWTCVTETFNWWHSYQTNNATRGTQKLVKVFSSKK